MAEVKQYSFSHKELVEALVKHLNVHEGYWGITYEFGIKAINIGPSEEQVLPTAMIPILKAGIQRVDKETTLSIDAAKVNPPPRPKVTAKKKGLMSSKKKGLMSS